MGFLVGYLIPGRESTGPESFPNRGELKWSGAGVCGRSEKEGETPCALAWDLWKFRLPGPEMAEQAEDAGSGAGMKVVKGLGKKLGTFGNFRFLVRGAAGVSVRRVLAGGGIGFEVVMAVFLFLAYSGTGSALRFVYYCVNGLESM
jgi:hypothetical protein